jgi:phage tail-like protein
MPSLRTSAIVDSINGYPFTLYDSAGARLAYFKGVDGINGEVEVIESTDGDDSFSLKQRKPRTVILYRVYFESDALTTWWLALQIPDSDDRRDLSLVVHDNAGNEIRSWNLYDCVLTAWTEDHEPRYAREITLTVGDIQIS